MTSEERARFERQALARGDAIVNAIERYQETNGRLPRDLYQLEMGGEEALRIEGFGYFQQEEDEKNFAGNAWVLFKRCNGLFGTTIVYYPNQNYPDDENWKKRKRWASLSTYGSD